MLFQHQLIPCGSFSFILSMRCSALIGVCMLSHSRIPDTSLSRSQCALLGENLLEGEEWGLDADAETAQTAVSPGQDAKTAVTKNAPASKRKHSACITSCSTAISPHAGTSSGSRGPRCCRHGNRSPLACSCLLSNWTPRPDTQAPRPSAAPSAASREGGKHPVHRW